MATKKKRSGEVAKIIHLPVKTVKGLGKLADTERMTVKPYIENVLINHEKNERKYT